MPIGWSPASFTSRRPSSDSMRCECKKGDMRRATRFPLRRARVVLPTLVLLPCFAAGDYREPSEAIAALLDARPNAILTVAPGAGRRLFWSDRCGHRSGILPVRVCIWLACDSTREHWSRRPASRRDARARATAHRQAVYRRRVSFKAASSCQAS